MADAMRDWLVAAFPSNKSESPIEALFYAAWQLSSRHLMVPDSPELVLTQQAPVGHYRADFLLEIRPPAGDTKRLVVELDGHAFHERTKEQAAKDKARDRWMTGAGYTVMRFTGSEVWANPFAVASEVADRVHQLRSGKSRKDARAEAGFAAIRALLAG
jgi:very-short-patch-repair endonuclease